jgi:hypothetical protein
MGSEWSNEDEANAMVRRHEIDALRGLLLVLMTLTHLPTRFSEYTGQPYGFVSAAEGFVFLSAFMVGWVYVGRAHKNGVAAMRRAVWRRALVLYACQAGLLLFLLAVIAPIGTAKAQPAITDLVSFFNHAPVAAVSSGLVLLYDPPLLDILPLYILFMLATPAVLTLSLRRGWAPILAFSFGLWLLAQFGVGQALYQMIASAARFDMPYAGTGSFSLLAWQFLWVIGLWMGSLKARGHPQDVATSRWVVAPAVVVAFVFIVWRHAVGQTPFPSGNGLNMLFDKWHLSPLRLLNFLALLVVALRWGNSVPPWLARPFLARLGAASLPVFCAHLVICLVALALFGDQYDRRGWDIDVALLLGAFALLYVVATVALRVPVLIKSGRALTQHGSIQARGVHQH